MTTPRLEDHHLADLRASGLDDETIRRAGLYSVTNETATMLVGFGRSGGLAFPYLHTASNGKPPFTRLKFDKPDAKGKRYAQAKGSGNRLYIPPTIDPASLKDPSVTLYLTEGEKKALKASQDGLPCVSVSGVDSWRSRTNGKSEPIADLDLITWKGRTVYIVFDSDLAMKPPVRQAEFKLARELRDRGAKVHAMRLPGGQNGEKVGLDDFLCTHSVDTFCALEPEEIHHPAKADAPQGPGTTTPELRREGFDLSLVWPGGMQFELAAIRETRDGVRGELTVTQNGRRLHWGAFALSSTQAREMLRKKLQAMAPRVRWGEYLEESVWHLSRAARQGEPIVTLTGVASSPTRELVPRFLYPGEPTLLYADGDTGKSLFAAALVTAVQGGASLPFGLRSVKSVPAVYLDWETSRDTIEKRLGLLAAGLGIAPPGILYKRMVRPLVDEAALLAAEFARRQVGLVVVDSMMFAVTSSEGAGYHEPITAFYSALRLFAPAASLVLSHVTGDDARRGGAARPFGGAFAFNGPRLVWEAKRDKDVTDATAIAFSCTKANNLPRRPDPFGLQFKDLGTSCQVSAFDLTEAGPQIIASASLSYRIQLLLARGIEDPKEISVELEAKVETVKRVLRRLRKPQGGADKRADNP